MTETRTELTQAAKLSAGWGPPQGVGTPRPFAAGRPRRFAMLPDAPPLREAGVAGCETTTRLVTAPCRHAVEIRRPLASEIDCLLLLPEVRDRLTAWGAEPVGGTPSGWTTRPPPNAPGGARRCVSQGSNRSSVQRMWRSPRPRP